MEKGSFSLEIKPKQTVQITSTGGFSCLALVDGKPIRVLGPDSSTVRKWRALPPPEADTLEIKTHESVLCSVEWFDTPSRKEEPDPTPIAIGISQKPESLQDMMARMIHGYMEANEKVEHETWEEADDFDMDDDDLPVSPYEVTELQEEYPIDKNLDPQTDDSNKSLETKEKTPDNADSTNSLKGTENATNRSDEHPGAESPNPPS